MTTAAAGVRTNQRRVACQVVAAAFAVAMAFSTLPTALYPLDQRPLARVSCGV